MDLSNINNYTSGQNKKGFKSMFEDGTLKSNFKVSFTYGGRQYNLPIVTNKGAITNSGTLKGKGVIKMVGKESQKKVLKGG